MNKSYKFPSMWFSTPKTDA